MTYPDEIFSKDNQVKSDRKVDVISIHPPKKWLHYFMSKMFDSKGISGLVDKNLYYDLD